MIGPNIVSDGLKRPKKSSFNGGLTILLDFYNNFCHCNAKLTFCQQHSHWNEIQVLAIFRNFMANLDILWWKFMDILYGQRTTTIANYSLFIARISLLSDDFLRKDE